MTTATATRWKLKRQGYEFCNCDFGCGCNFGGFPNSKEGAAGRSSASTSPGARAVMRISPA